MSYRRFKSKLRRLYDSRCGYCGIHESEAGGELEIDHYQPQGCGGQDTIDNLVYCCPLCNSFKHDYWPTAKELTAGQRILHPKRDNLSDQITTSSDGRLMGLTTTGKFHIERLNLNRLGLVALRQHRVEDAGFV